MVLNTYTAHVLSLPINRNINSHITFYLFCPSTAFTTLECMLKESTEGTGQMHGCKCKSKSIAKKDSFDD